MNGDATTLDAAATSAQDDVLALFIESAGMFAIPVGALDRALSKYLGKSASELQLIIRGRTRGIWNFDKVTSVVSLLVILADLDESEPVAAAETRAAMVLANEMKANGAMSFADYNEAVDASEALLDAIGTEPLLSARNFDSSNRITALADRLCQPGVTASSLGLPEPPP